MSFDPSAVYFVSVYVGPTLLNTDIVTEVSVFDSKDPEEDRRVSYWAMRSSGPHQGAYPTHQIETDDSGRPVAWRTDMTKDHRLPVKYVYDLLTLENFATLRPYVTDYDLIVSQAKTDAGLRAWYREAMLP